MSETASPSVRRAFHALWLRGLRASALRRYGVGVVAAIGASLIRILLNPFWGTSFLPYIFLFPATLFTALCVQDTGIGISPDLLPRVFELLMQGDPGSHRGRTGLGIGLAVVHRLIELHGGTVQASSEPGTGSTFTVRLPRIPRHPARPNG